MYIMLHKTSVVWTHATVGPTVGYYLVSFLYKQRLIWNVVTVLYSLPVSANIKQQSEAPYK